MEFERMTKADKDQSAAPRKNATKPGKADKPKDARPEPSTEELKEISKAAKSLLARRPSFQCEVKSINGQFHTGSRHSNTAGFSVMALNAFGTRSYDFASQGIGRLASVMRAKGEKHPDEQVLNTALAMVDGLQPQNEMEAALAMQMAATHEVAMEMLTRAKQAETIPVAEYSGNLAVKLLRTYTTQIEALAKLRRGGEQTVRVEHVTVNAGGQAIVGAVSGQGGGVFRKTEDQCHATPAAVTYQPETDLRSQDTEREALPVFADAERSMPDARGHKPRRTEGE
jgi:hypothetical protein